MSTVVIQDRAALMQRLMDAVIQGYHSYTSGTVKAERVHALCTKFSERYLIDLNRNQLAYRRAKGQGNARLVLADFREPGCLHWWLMVTDGAHPTRERDAREDLKDALTPGERLCVRDFELLKLPRANDVGDGVRLTWCMTEEAKRRWRFQIRTAVRSGQSAHASRRIVQQLYKSPGFDSIKTQVDKLTDFLRAEWARSGRDVQLLTVPDALKPVRRLASGGVPVAEWVASQTPRTANSG